MTRKYDDQDGPYEFERPVRSTESKIGPVASGVAGFVIAGAMLSGVAFAVNATSQPEPSRSVNAQPLVNFDSEVEDEHNSDSDGLFITEETGTDSTSPANEISTPTSVILPTFSSDDEDEDEDEDENHEEHFEGEHEDSEDESDDSSDD